MLWSCGRNVNFKFVQLTYAYEGCGLKHGGGFMMRLGSLKPGGSRELSRKLTAGVSPSYVCGRGYQDGDEKTCQCMTSRPVDAAVVEAFLAAVSPISLRVATQVLDQVEQNLIDQHRQRALQLEQARYEARLAQRQYDAVDPSNRLVAGELERRWNEKLERVAQLERMYAQAERDAEWNLTAEERAAIAELSRDLPAIWSGREGSPARAALLARPRPGKG